MVNGENKLKLDFPSKKGNSRSAKAVKANGKNKRTDSFERVEKVA